MNTLTCDTCVGFSRATEIEQLEISVRSRLRGRVFGLRVLSRDNGVVLKGNSRSYYAKQLAQHAVMQATELPILANEIQVGRSERVSLGGYAETDQQTGEY
jgi:hypothetical protein